MIRNMPRQRLAQLSPCRAEFGNLAWFGIARPLGYQRIRHLIAGQTDLQLSVITKSDQPFMPARLIPLYLLHRQCIAMSFRPCWTLPASLSPR